MSSEEAFTHRVAVALKRRRLVFGWSQTEASRHLRVLPAQLSRWETRFHTPQLQRLWHICKVYGLTPAELLREDEPLLPPGWPPEALDALRDCPELREAVAAILQGGGEGGEP